MAVRNVDVLEYIYKDTAPCGHGSVEIYMAPPQKVSGLCPDGPIGNRSAGWHACRPPGWLYI